MRERVLHQTTSLCRECKNGLSAEVVSTEAGHVWMKKTCPTHGPQNVMLSTNAEWYERTRATKPRLRPPPKKRPVDVGCPFDCGPCESHEASVRLPVVTVTSRCNIDCPICYVHNKNEDPYNMTEADFRRVLEHLTEAHGGELDIINMTGGEPTLHPNFLDLIRMCKDAGVHRVTICSNGIELAKKEHLVEELAALNARVALSFDSFDRDVSYEMQGAHLIELKMKALDVLEKHGVDTTLIPVMTKGLNDREIGRIIDLGFSKTNIRHLEIHTITYTGQGGVHFDVDRSGRISMYEVLEAIEETTNGMLTVDDWVPSPHAHPLCYQIAYLLMDDEGGPPVPFSRLIGNDVLYDCLSERLYLEPTPRLERAMRDAIDRLWTEGEERTLAILKRLLKEMFPSGRTITPAEALAIGERSTKAIYIHSHMDEETFDTERIVQCCDSNCYADGSTIPVCAYNVLYRETEEHFMLKPAVWSERIGGRRTFRAGLPVVEA